MPYCFICGRCWVLGSNLRAGLSLASGYFDHRMGSPWARNLRAVSATRFAFSGKLEDLWVFGGKHAGEAFNPHCMLSHLVYHCGNRRMYEDTTGEPWE
jgi:hypothetical protein